MAEQTVVNQTVKEQLSTTQKNEQAYFSKIDEVFSKQRLFFNKGGTLDLKFRKKQLKKFKQVLQKNEKGFIEAIYKDFRKSEFDTFVSELNLLYSEINLAISNLNSWAKKERVFTNLINIPSASYILKEPYGNSLIIGAWNYPILLTLNPVVSAIAAGNTAIIKPSGTTAAVSNHIAKVINETFPEEYIFVIEGRGSMVDRVMDNPFDKIFFTGSPNVGKQIMKKASEYLAGVTLELGGKSPCLFTEEAITDVALQRLAWGKFFNAGQTCVAPDYILVPENAKDKFLTGIKKAIEKVIGTDYVNSEAYCQIATERHLKRFDNILELQKNQIFYGGEVNYEERYLSPTVLQDVTLDDEIMKEEVFGPIMPVITYKNLDEAIDIIKKYPKPLSFQYFTKQSKVRERLLNEIPSGSGCVNDALVFMTNHKLPFGGVGNSGSGKYHGKYGFEAFSNQKGVIDRPLWFEPPIKYRPYSSLKQRLISLFS